MPLLRWPAGFLSSALIVAVLLTFGLPATAAGENNRRVPEGGDLQQALNDARPGDRIMLQPGAVYTGNFVLPVHNGAEFITITTDPAGGGLPGVGGRITPGHAPRLAVITSPNARAALRTEPRAHHWRIQLLEFRAGRSSDVILLGDGGSAQQSLRDVPSHLIVDRCYIHGNTETPAKRGIALNSGRTVIVGSHISGFARPGQDTQAIGGWNGPGPYQIENNRLEAASENFMLGGARPSIPDLVPTDITFRRNYVTKPLSWREQKIAVKNLFELKNARRVLVEYNVFEHNWASGQAGFAIVLTPRSDNGRTPWATVEDVTFRFNIVRHAGAGMNVLGRDDDGPPSQLRRLRVAHNLFYDIDDDRWKGSGAFLQIGNGAADVIVDHNTVWHSGTLLSAYGKPSRAEDLMRGFTFRDNLARHNRYGVHGSGRAVGQDTLDALFPSVTFVSNVLAGGKPSLYPSDNLFPSVAEFEDQFVDPAAHDYRLKANSSFRRQGSDGRDLGADVSLIIAGVPPDEPEESVARAPHVEPGIRRVPSGVPIGLAVLAGTLLLGRAVRGS